MVFIFQKWTMKKPKFIVLYRIMQSGVVQFEMAVIMIVMQSCEVRARFLKFTILNFQIHFKIWCHGECEKYNCCHIERVPKSY